MHRERRPAAAGCRAGVFVAGLVLAVTAAGAAPAPAEDLDFDRVFAAGRDDGQAYYAATYRLDGREHRIEVWRDGSQRIRRRTDDAVDTYLVRPVGQVEWTMSVLDRERKIRTDVDRTNLLRIGHFTDWFAQAHSLTRPRGPYRLTRSGAAPAGAAAIGPCRWYRLEQAGRSSEVCWSTSARVPLVIRSSEGEVVWRVTRLASGPFPAGVFAIDDRGFVHNDANRDIQAD